MTKRINKWFDYLAAYYNYVAYSHGLKSRITSTGIAGAHFVVGCLLVMFAVMFVDATFITDYSVYK